MYYISLLVTVLAVFNLRCTVAQQYFGVPLDLEANEFNIWDEEFINDDPNIGPNDVSSILCDQYDITLNGNAVDCSELKFALKPGKVWHHLRKRDVEDTPLEGSGADELEHNENETTPEQILTQTETTTVNIQLNAASFNNKTNDNIATPNADQATTPKIQQITESVEKPEVQTTNNVPTTHKQQNPTVNLEESSTEINVAETTISRTAFEPFVLKENIPQPSEDNELAKIAEDEANPILLKEPVVQEEENITETDNPSNEPEEPNNIETTTGEEHHQTTIKPELYETQASKIVPFAVEAVPVEDKLETNASVASPAPIKVSTAEEKVVNAAATESNIVAKSATNAVVEVPSVTLIEETPVTDAEVVTNGVVEQTEASSEHKVVTTVVTDGQLKVTTKTEQHEELHKVQASNNNNQPETVDARQSSNVVVDIKEHGSSGVEIRESDKTIMNMATGAEIKEIAAADEPNTGESSRDVQRASKDTTVLIVLFAIVLAVGALAVSYNYVQKRKRRANSQVRNGNSIRRSSQNTTNNGNPDIEKGTEMKPLMTKEFTDNGTVEKINEK